MVHSPVASPRTPAAAIETISIASAEKGRMPPIEKRKKSFSGKASMTRRVSLRCPCQCCRSASGVITRAGAGVFGIFGVMLVVIIPYLSSVVF